MYDPKVIRRRRAALAVMIVACIVLLTASFGGSGGGPVGSIQDGVFQIVSPIQDGASRALKPVRDLFGWFGDTIHAKSDNKSLRAERDRLRAEVAQLQEDSRTNAQLRGLVGLDRQANLSSLDPVTARVTAASSSVWYQQMTINKGSSAGVAEEQPVVAGNGGQGVDGALVGKVYKTFGGYSVVRLLTDSDFAVGARVSGTSATGPVSPAPGNPRDLLMQDTSPDQTVHTGAIVVTRGTDSPRGNLPSLFPPGIPIGRVTRVEARGTDSQVVHLRPFVDRRNLDFVQVVTKTASPPSS